MAVHGVHFKCFVSSGRAAKLSGGLAVNKAGPTVRPLRDYCLDQEWEFNRYYARMYMIPHPSLAPSRLAD